MWTQWTEAGQTWLQWWLASLPQMPWPPAGVVVDIAESNPMPATPAMPAAPLAAAPQRKARSLRRAAPTPRRHDAPKVNGARHH